MLITLTDYSYQKLAKTHFISRMYIYIFIN